MKTVKLGLFAAMVAGAAVCATPALSAPGDVHRVMGQKVNLRSGPSDDANIRGTVSRGDRLVELRREGSWIGVRSEDTGAEGWIYGELLEVAAQSSLGGGTGEVPKTAGFESYSKEFDSMLAAISGRLGVPVFDKIERMGENGLRLVPSEAFLRDGSEDAHLLAALAVHQMWKNHQNGRPVKVSVLGENGRRYLDLDDAAGADKLLQVEALRSATR